MKQKNRISLTNTNPNKTYRTSSLKTVKNVTNGSDISKQKRVK